MARGKSNHAMFHKIMGNVEKMQAIGDIISYFSHYYFNCHAKKCTKIQLGENIWYFFSQCLYFSPLRPRILLSQTVYWGENNARGKSNHIFPAEHNLFLWQFLSWVFQLGENIWYFLHLSLFFPLSFFSPLCLYFFPLGLHFLPPRLCN